MADVKEIPHPAVPGVGALPYKELHLLSPSPAGVTRPFGKGEYMINPNGSWSNEMATTVAHPALNWGKPTNVPTLWIKDGKPVRLSDDEAAIAAAQNNLSLPSYRNEAAAKIAAITRENTWQSIEPQNAGSVAPLWSVPTPTPRPDNQ